MTVRTALIQGTALVSSRADAEVLLAHAMHVDRAYFYAHPEQELREVEWIHYGRYLHERMQKKPVQYITRKQEFFGREFRVTPDVLIPRPETELLVETVLEHFREIRTRPLPSRDREGAVYRSPKNIVDVGTGSGAIAVTLALESAATVIATDLSRRALRVAAENAAGLTAPVELIECDLASSIADVSVDAVVSNPPYVAETDRATLQPEIRDWEPPLALFAGESGLEVYRRLIPDAWRVLRQGGFLALEVGFGQAEAVLEIAADWRNRRVYPDLAGVPRVLVCEKP